MSSFQESVVVVMPESPKPASAPNKRARRELFHCDECDFVTAHKGNVRRHVEGMHRKKTNKALAHKEFPRKKTSPEESLGKAKDVPMESPGKAKTVPKESPGKAKDVPKESPGKAKTVPKESPGKAKTVPKESPGKAKIVPKASPDKAVTKESARKSTTVAKKSPGKAKAVHNEFHEPSVGLPSVTDTYSHEFTSDKLFSGSVQEGAGAVQVRPLRLQHHAQAEREAAHERHAQGE